MHTSGHVAHKNSALADSALPLSFPEMALEHALPPRIQADTQLLSRSRLLLRHFAHPLDRALPGRDGGLGPLLLLEYGLQPGDGDLGRNRVLRLRLDLHLERLELLLLLQVPMHLDAVLLHVNERDDLELFDVAPQALRAHAQRLQVLHGLRLQPGLVGRHLQLAQALREPDVGVHEGLLGRQARGKRGGERRRDALAAQNLRGDLRAWRQEVQGVRELGPLDEVRLATQRDPRRGGAELGLHLLLFIVRALALLGGAHGLDVRLHAGSEEGVREFEGGGDVELSIFAEFGDALQ